MIGKDINKYFELVSAFDRYKDSVKPSVYFLGLSGEVGELCDVIYNAKDFPFITKQEDIDKITGEFGDVFWYWFALAQNLGIDYNKIWNGLVEKEYDTKIPILKLVASVGRLTEHLKKSFRDDDGKITPKRLENINENMYKTLDNLFAVCSFISKTPYEILQKNYDKLAARHVAGTLQGEGDGISGNERKKNNAD